VALGVLDFIDANGIDLSQGQGWFTGTDEFILSPGHLPPADFLPAS